MNPTPERKSAVQYAEEVLGVHVPWDEAQRRLELHAQASENVDLTRGELRANKQSLEDRKLEVATEAPSLAGYPEGVQARRDWTKLLIVNDEKIVKYEQQIAHLQTVLEDYQSQVKHHELGLHVLTARMTELGGLLMFYAAAKQAENTTLHTTVSPVSQHTQGEPVTHD